MLYDKLYDWQRSIVDNLSKRQFFGLWLDCGLGKTVQALALAEKNGADKILIVTPNAKACETAETSGSWHQWARELGADWRIVSKNGKSVRGVSHEASVADETIESFVQNKKPSVKLSLTTKVTASDVPKNGTSKINFSEGEKTVYIVNYESLFVHGNKGSRVQLKPEILAFIGACRHNNVTLLLDESHYIKDPSSQQTVALMAIKRELMVVAQTLHIYLMTGTPFTKGFIDVWNQLKFLGCPMTKTEFREKFCVIGNVRGLLGWQQPIIGYKNVDDLYKLIHQYALTLKSDDVLKLPEQLFEEHIDKTSPWFKLLTQERMRVSTLVAYNKTRAAIGLPSIADDDPLSPQHLVDVWCGEHGHLYMPLEEAVKKDVSVQNPWCRNLDYPNSDWACETAGALWMRARQLSIGFQGNAENAMWFGNARLSAIEKFLSEHEDNYVLFYNYVPEFVSLFEICTALGYNVDVYNGEIKSLLNYERYSNETEAEQLVDKKNIILSNFASGSTGMNWQAYSSCIIASLPTYKHWAQGLKRVHRNGSKETVRYHVFMSDSWLDRDMWDALINKVEYSDEMFNKQLNLVNNL